MRTDGIRCRDSADTGSVVFKEKSEPTYRPSEHPPVMGEKVHQGSSSNGCCLFRHHHGPTIVRLYFPTLSIGMTGRYILCTTKKGCCNLRADLHYRTVKKNIQHASGPHRTIIIMCVVQLFFPCPRSRLRIWSRETGSAAPSRVSLLILHTRAECYAYSRDSYRFPRRRPFTHLNRHRHQSRVNRVTTY